MGKPVVGEVVVLPFPQEDAKLLEVKARIRPLFA